jgi:MFS family permease
MNKVLASEGANSIAYVLWSTIVAALGGFLFGFDTAVISGTISSLEQVFSLNEFLLGFTVAVALIGTIIGSISSGKPSERFGRRPIMSLLGGFFLISALGCALTNNWYLFLAFRFIGGLGIGGASVISPMYIAELSPARMRGRLVAVQQLSIVLGILIAFLSNYLIAGMIAHHAWRWMFGVGAIPAFLFMVLVFFIPDSPGGSSSGIGWMKRARY